MFDIDMPFWAAAEPCGACGAQVDKGEQWWSGPLGEALVEQGLAAIEVGEQMKALYHPRLVAPWDCVSRRSHAARDHEKSEGFGPFFGWR